MFYDRQFGVPQLLIVSFIASILLQSNRGISGIAARRSENNCCGLGAPNNVANGKKRNWA
jgi:hypothetical protein